MIKKRILSLFFAFVLLFSLAGSVSAQVIDEATLKDMEKPSYGERFTANIFISIANWFIDVLGAQDVSYMVFQDNLSSDGDWLSDGFAGSRDELVYGVFPEKYFSGILMLYEGFEKITPIPIVVLISLMGLLLLFSNFTGDDRSKIKDYLLGALYVVVALRFGIEIWNIMFDINYFLIDLVYQTATNNGVNISRFLDTIWGDQDSYNKIIEFQSLGLAILVFLAFCMTFVLNYQYALRMITLSILFLIFPIVLIGLMFPSRRHAFALWVHETASQIFMQFAHAVALVLFFYLTQNVENISFWLIFAYFFGLPVVVSLVQKVVGAFTGIQSGGGGVMSNMGSMLGFAAMSNMGRIFSGIRGKQKSEGTGSDGGGFNSKKQDPLIGPKESMLNSENVTGNKIPITNGKQNPLNGRIPNNKSSATKRVMPSFLKGSAMFAGAMTAGATSAMVTGNFSPGAAVGSKMVDKLGSKVGKPLSNKNDKKNDPFGEGFINPSSIDLTQMKTGPGEHLNDNPNNLVGEFKLPITTDTSNTPKNISELQNELKNVQMNRKHLDQPIQHAKERLEKAQAQYGKGSAYHNQLVSNFASAKQEYQQANSALSKINQKEQPQAYQQQSLLVNQLKGQMEHHQQMVNTPHPDIQNAQQNLSTLTKQAKNYDKAIQDYKNQISSAYSPTKNGTVENNVTNNRPSTSGRKEIITSQMPTGDPVKQTNNHTNISRENNMDLESPRKTNTKAESENQQLLFNLISKRNSRGSL